MIWTYAVRAVPVRYLFRFSEISDTRAEWHGRILGNDIAEYSGLHAVCEKPAATDAWASSRAAHHHDPLFVDWNSRDFGHGGNLRNCDLGSCAIAEPLSFARSRGDFVAGDS